MHFYFCTVLRDYLLKVSLNGLQNRIFGGCTKKQCLQGAVGVCICDNICAPTDSLNYYQ